MSQESQVSWAEPYDPVIDWKSVITVMRRPEPVVDFLSGFVFRVPESFLKNKEFQSYLTYDAYGNPWTNAISGDRFIRVDVINHDPLRILNVAH